MSLRGKLSFGSALLRARMLGEIRPLFCQISVTNRCNANCRYCNYRFRYPEEMSTGELLSVIDQLAELGTRRISLWGGEPLLRDDIGEIVAHIKSKGINCAMNSNGYLVPQKREVVAMLDQFALSLDGPKEAHDANREPGSYDKAIRALEVLKEMGIPTITNVPFTKNNVSDKVIDFLLDHAEKYDYKISFLILKHTLEKGKRAWKFMPSDDQLRKAISKLISEKRKGRPVLFSEFTYEMARNWPDYSADRRSDGDLSWWRGPRCYAGRLSINIDTNGDLYPCAASTVGDQEHMNCVRYGVRKALEYVSRHTCRVCYIPCRIEYNALFSLNPRVLLNVGLNYREKGL
ncbi:MAG: hypothetical protein AMS15_01250 [Planctomycetes bacterium DG_23]|nr:MAG: hypothetical protein AMS15_01250 [Planctomycetes bacterium DG_23]